MSIVLNFIPPTLTSSFRDERGPMVEAILPQYTSTRLCQLDTLLPKLCCCKGSLALFRISDTHGRD